MDQSSELEMFAIWEKVNSVMREKFTGTEQIFSLWFDRMQLSYLDSDNAVFVVENEMKRSVVTKRFLGLLGESLESVLGYRPDITVNVDESLAPEVPDDGTLTPLKIVKMHQAEKTDNGPDGGSGGDRKDGRSSPSQPATEWVDYAVSPAVEEEEKRYEEQQPTERKLSYNEDYTFENFIVGNSNRFAYAAAKNVADNPGMKINPLFIWGPSGLGKTHLMYSIANRVLKRDPRKKVIYVKGEEFMNQLIEAIQKNRNFQFRQKYRSADMLLIDDIQFIAGKESTQMEFFHTFEALYEDRKQIVLTSDRPPKELTALEDRIRSRFEAGLLADIQPPDYELRLAILRNKISQNGVEMPQDVIDFLAQNLQENIRQLEGVVKKLAMTKLLTGHPVNMEMVLTAVPEYLHDTEPVSETVNRILTVTAQQCGVSVDEIMGPSRKKEIKTARNIAMYTVRNVTGLSLPQIGAIFSRDHSTVHSNINMIETELLTDPIVDAKVSQIIKEIKHN